MIYRTRPRSVEAKQAPEDAYSIEMTEFRQWLGKHGLNVVYFEDRGYFHIYAGGKLLATTFSGRWVVIQGAEEVTSLKTEQFEKFYEWTGPAYLVN